MTLRLDVFMNFTEQDLQQLNQFRQFLNTKAAWQLSSTDAVALVQHFQFLHTLAQKVEANIFELKKLVNPKPSTENT